MWVCIHQSQQADVLALRLDESRHLVRHKAGEAESTESIRATRLDSAYLVDVVCGQLLDSRKRRRHSVHPRRGKTEDGQGGVEVLDPALPVFGLAAPGVDGVTPPLARVEELAR